MYRVLLWHADVLRHFFVRFSHTNIYKSIALWGTSRAQRYHLCACWLVTPRPLCFIGLVLQYKRLESSSFCYWGKCGFLDSLGHRDKMRLMELHLTRQQIRKLCKQLDSARLIPEKRIAHVYKESDYVLAFQTKPSSLGGMSACITFSCKLPCRVDTFLELL